MGILQMASGNASSGRRHHVLRWACLTLLLFTIIQAFATYGVVAPRGRLCYDYKENYPGKNPSGDGRCTQEKIIQRRISQSA